MGLFDRRRGRDEDEHDRRREPEYYEDTHNARGDYTGRLNAFSEEYNSAPTNKTGEQYMGYPAGGAPQGSMNLGGTTNGARKNYNVMIYSPKDLDDVQTLIDFLKRREPAIVNLKEGDMQNAQRILDFISGAIYALNGSVHRIADNIFLLSPEDVEITVPYNMHDF